MLESKYTRVSRVEDFMTRMICGAGVSGQVFVSALPVTLKKEWRDMVLVDVGKGVNRDAYVSYSVNVFLYGKPTGDLQRKDAVLIDGMEERLMRAIGAVSEAHYSIRVEWCDSGYDDTRNYHYNVVGCTVTAHETDN